MSTEAGLNGLKLQRKTARGAFTKCFNELVSELAGNDIDPESVGFLNATLKDKYERLQKLEEECGVILRTTLDGEEWEAEAATTESYHDKMAEITYKMRRLGKERADQELERTTGASREPAYRLPQLTLSKFELSFQTWLPFWAQYKGIYDNPNLNVSDKFQYLLMSLEEGTEARDMMLSFPQEEGHLNKAVEALKNRYGRKEILIEIYTRELINLVLSHKEIALGRLFDKISAHLRALESLGATSAMCAFVLYPLVESCLPTETLRAWERKRVDVGESLAGSRDGYNPLDDLMAFIAEEVRAEDRILLASRPLRSSREERNSTSTAAALNTTVISDTPHTARKLVKRCIFCSKEHNSHECMRELDLREKERMVQEMKVCFKCLNKGHRAVKCKAFVRCLYCKKSHHVIMCPTLSTSSESKNKGNEKSVVCLSVREPRTTYLKTMLVHIVHEGRTQEVRTLVDDGAQRNYIATSVLEKLNVMPVAHEVITHGLFGGQRGPTKRYACYELQVKGVLSETVHKIQAVGERVICDYFIGPSMMRDKELFNELKEKGITLTDTGDTERSIELLLGAEALGYLLTGNMHVLKNGITAIETKLGWSIVGSSSKRAKAMISLCLNAVHLPDVWGLETLGISEPIALKPKEEESVALQFDETIQREGDGRFIVKLPWMTTCPPVQENFNIAMRRLLTTTERLNKEGLYEAYDEVLKEWENTNIIETVLEPEDQEETKQHYLPHRPVVKRRTEGSLKVRPVFDASSKQQGGISLNQCLHKGPNLLQEIPQLLLKFRLHQYGVFADVRQAFLQIGVHPADREFLRFLWWGEDGQVKVYRHCRVVFGLSCSPFILNTLISKLIEAELQEQPPGKSRDLLQKLKGSFYVDDTISAHETKEEVEEFITEATRIMQGGKFELCKWTSNAPWLKKGIAKTRVLGMEWDLQTDFMNCGGVPTRGSKSFTKRNLLRQVSSIYDPIGVLSPATLVAKIILQQTWKMNLGWDDSLPEPLRARFEIWTDSLAEIENIQIPRKLGSGNLSTGKGTIHVFADACQTSYGCCIYYRNEEQEQVSVQLIGARARVAPLQAHTIPRLELLAACIAVRLYHSLKSGLPENVQATFWTDSMTVLWWVTKAHPWATFVGNRVREIRIGSDPKNWKHVPGIMNPADRVSRGCTVDELKNSRWWEGPMWLREPENKWPLQKIEATKEALAEMSTVSCTIIEGDEFLSTITRYFSSYRKTIRMIAWMLRWCNKKKGTLTVEEIKEAEERILKILQINSNVRLKEIEMVKDGKGLLRVSSRVSDTGLEVNHNLLLLPNEHKLVTLLIRERHQDLGHAGVETTLTELRKNFWIVRGRKTIKSIIGRCTRCQRFQSRRYRTEPSQLPVDRTNVGSVAFETTGVDLFGPLFLRNGEKVWGVLFTCAVYRGVRLDLVTSLSTECFVRALRRFIARHSSVTTIYSDNGTNFKGLANNLREEDWDKVTEFTTKRRLKMIQNPPAAPWWGGFFERMVGLVKQVLKKQLGRAMLSHDELLTLLYETEAIVNSRPLTYVSEDPRDLQPLTPSHFLQESPGEATEDLNVTDRRSLIRRVQYISEIRAHLRQRFINEYLSLLTQRSSKATGPIRQGQVVLIETENKKRFLWPLGKVVEIYPGRDGVIRVARVVTEVGEITRPVQKLYPLEMGDEEAKCKEIRGNESSHIDKGTGKSEEVELKSRVGRPIKKPQKLDL